MDIQTPADTEKIRDLNDRLRSEGIGGLVITTRSVASLPFETKAALMAAVMLFSEFDEDNDPHGEHDFGTVTVESQKFYWKIDYYDRSMEMGSPDPTNPHLTKRVMTVMRSDEY